MQSNTSALLLFPHQLFETVLDTTKDVLVILIEDDLFFTQYKFHKQKLILHRASMQAFRERLAALGFTVEYIQTSKVSSMDAVEAMLTKHNITAVQYYDLVDDWLEQRLTAIIQKLDIQSETIPSPAFLTSRGAIDEYFASKPDRMQSFYEWQRKRLNVLVKDGKPVGGKWSFDTDNRKKLPKDIELPPPYTMTHTTHVRSATTWVQADFPDNVGTANSFQYATTHDEAHNVLEQFLERRLALFGPYEDAVDSEESQLFHSVLSPLLNIGLLTPRQVVTRTLQYAEQHDTPIASLEGFIRQIIGWREYMRATYVRYGRTMRSQNKLNHTHALNAGWWDGAVGIAPIDNTIRRVLETAYAHHIERLMVFGNAMVLLRTHPDDVYEWFMTMFIDAYDWVMVPNVYAMSQFAVGAKITTKPYISGSNYIIKMSNYKKDDWAEVWDALYWRFIADNQALFEANPRSSMMPKLYNKLSSEKKDSVTEISNRWLH